MHHTQRLDQRLYALREEVRAMTWEKERGERAWRERLQRCQNQLKAKEEEMGRQSKYFENYKAQLQHKLSLARDRDQSLQRRVHVLEKQLLDVTVSAATNTATVPAVSITAGSLPGQGEPESLPPRQRGEGEGEEEGVKKKEEERRRRRQQQRPGSPTEGGNEEEMYSEVEGEKESEGSGSLNEAKLRCFILSLQEDLRALLEREEKGAAERRGMTEHLQEAQESGHLLACRVEEARAEVRQLELSECCLREEVKELREENHNLRQRLVEDVGQTPGQSFTLPGSTSALPDQGSPSISPSESPAWRCKLAGNSGEIPLQLDEQKTVAPPPPHHQSTVESRHNHVQGSSSPVEANALRLRKPDDPKLSVSLNCQTNATFQSLPLAAETTQVGELNLGDWCTRGTLNLEASPSKENDALLEAYRSLGLGGDSEALEQQRDCLEAQVQRLSQENSRLKIQLRKQAEEQEAEAGQGSVIEKNDRVPTQDTSNSHDCTDHVPPSLIQDKNQDDLVRALNRENHAMAEHIQELLAHNDLREGESAEVFARLSAQVSRLVADGARLKQENQEHGCLITELTKKTEDDLNTIMELQQRLEESHQNQVPDNDICGGHLQSDGAVVRGHQNKPEAFGESLVDTNTEEPESIQHPNHVTKDSMLCSQADDHGDPSNRSPTDCSQIDSLTDRVDKLSKSVQKLSEEQEELTNSVNSLREEQREVAQSVETQLEEKRRLTRTLWGLKEERDGVAQSMTVLVKEREQLTKTLCGARDERDRLSRSTAGLKEERDQLAKAIAGLKEEREEVLQSPSAERGEGDKIEEALQSLEKESGARLESLRHAQKQRDPESPDSPSNEERDTLMQSARHLKDEKERIELSITALREEEEQLRRSLSALIKERTVLQVAALHNRSQADGRFQKQQSPEQEQGDLRKEIEALGAELQNTRKLLAEAKSETRRLGGELRESEARREGTEKEAVLAGSETKRTTDLACQVEVTREENGLLMTQVAELQSRLGGLAREKNDAVSLKARMEELFNEMQAQLKAKTVALEELNSEYTASLRREQGSRDLNTALISLRTRYNDIRAKYDVLLKKKSQADLDVAPLKAKLSCLVMKCQERNVLLVQMMRALRRHGPVDRALSQPAEHLLGDTALQEYSAVFTPGAAGDEGHRVARGSTPGFVSKLRDYSSGFTGDQSGTPALPAGLALGANHDALVSGSGLEDGEHFDLSVPTSKMQEHSSTLAPTSPVDQKLKENLPLSPASSSIKRSPSPAAVGADQTQGVPEGQGPNCDEVKGEPISVPASFSQAKSLGSAPPSPNRRKGLSRRLSSPEKIVNLHQELQRTLSSSYQALVGRRGSVDIRVGDRGRGQLPRPSLLESASPELELPSQTRNQSPARNTPGASPLPVVGTTPSQAKQPPIRESEPITTTAKTLFDAVSSRSANLTFRTGWFTRSLSKVSTDGFSSSSTVADDKSNLTSSSSDTVSPPKIPPKSSKPTMQTKTTQHSTTTAFTPRTNSSLNNAVGSAVTAAGSTASDTTAPGKLTASKGKDLKSTQSFTPAVGALHGADPPHSSERSFKPAAKATALGERVKAARTPSEAPVEVGSVEVVRTVGQSSLMVGWERPALDELGCSNGTFVYGYRVYVDGEFHKSVMSSACTKCILENVDLGLPVHIGVQTLGSNGLVSNRVQTLYRTPAALRQHIDTVESVEKIPVGRKLHHQWPNRA